MPVDADKAHSSLIGRSKLLEEHAAQGTSPSGLRIKKVQAKGQNVEAPQAKFDGIMASRKASHVEVDPQVAVKPSNAKGQPLPNGLTDLKSGQKTPEEKVQAT